MPRHSWRTVARWTIRSLAILVMAPAIIYPLLSASTKRVERLNALFLLTLFATSLAYLLYVSAHVRLDLPGINALVAKSRGSRAASSPRPKGAPGDTGQQATGDTIQVSRLSASGARINVVNDSPLPVLNTQAAMTLVREEESGQVPDESRAHRILGTALSIPAHGTQPTAMERVFDHVGIFVLRSEGVRVFDLIGLASRTCGERGQWRVRVVPNMYRLTRGIPRRRNASQESLGIPSAPADALDYDRVRDYRPGDPLKTIHWKLVAHGQGEFYTKLFETPTISSVTLVIDPFGPRIEAATPDTAYHLHDTMLEGGFSLIEHARESGISGRLRFVGRNGELTETHWEGHATLGWFVEAARRPQPTQEALEQSILAIRSLQVGRPGYVIFATSRLDERTVRALIDSRGTGASLLVVHALPAATGVERDSQLALDKRLQQASIDVVGLTDGAQIVQEVSTP